MVDSATVSEKVTSAFSVIRPLGGAPYPLGFADAIAQNKMQLQTCASELSLIDYLLGMCVMWTSVCRLS